MGKANIEMDESQEKTDYLFVYGTLRKADKTGASSEYLRGADFVSTAKIRGKLFMVKDYPGLVLSETDHWTTGEMYLLGSEAQLHHLDVYEGCAKNSPKPHEYKRIVKNVILSGGDSVDAWVYVYERDTSTLKLIESGDFLA